MPNREKLRPNEIDLRFAIRRPVDRHEIEKRLAHPREGGRAKKRKHTLDDDLRQRSSCDTYRLGRET